MPGKHIIHYQWFYSCNLAIPVAQNPRITKRAIKKMLADEMFTILLRLD